MGVSNPGYVVYRVLLIDITRYIIYPLILADRTISFKDSLVGNKTYSQAKVRLVTRVDFCVPSSADVGLQLDDVVCNKIDEVAKKFGFTLKEK